MASKVGQSFSPLRVFANTNKQYRDLMNSLCEQYKNKQHTDYKLKLADGSEIAVHKNILAAQIPFFSALFRSGMKDSCADFCDLDHLEAKSIKLIVEFIYGQNVEVGWENVKGVVQAASFFQLPELVKAVDEYIIWKIVDTTAREWHEFAQLYNLQLTVEWLEINFNSQITQENNEPETHQSQSSRRKTRSQSKKEKEVAKQKVCQEDKIVHRRVAVGMKFNVEEPTFSLMCSIQEEDENYWHYLASVCQHLPQNCASCYKHVVVSPVPQGIFFSGGYLDHSETEVTPLADCALYDTIEDRYVPVPSMPKWRLFHGAVAVEKKLYIFGGYAVDKRDESFNLNWLDNHEASKSVDCLDLTTMSWSSRADTRFQIRKPECVAVGKDIYCLDFSKFLRYDTEADYWIELADIPFSSSLYPSKSILYRDGNIYAAGQVGLRGTDVKPHGIARYNIDTDVWTVLSVLNHGFIDEVESTFTFAIDDEMYSVACDEVGKEGSVYVYDYHTNMWVPPQVVLPFRMVEIQQVFSVPVKRRVAAGLMLPIRLVE